jgi:hypothetical protein
LLPACEGGRPHRWGGLAKLAAHLVEAGCRTARFGDHYDVRGLWKKLSVLAKHLSHQPLYAVSTHCVADLLRDGQAQPLVRQLVLANQKDEALRMDTAALVAGATELEPLTQTVSGR